MNEIAPLIPCNIWTFLLVVTAWFLLVSIADKWDTNEKYNQLKDELDQQNQELSDR